MCSDNDVGEDPMGADGIIKAERCSQMCKKG